MGNLFKVVDSGGSDVTLASSDYGADSITLNAAPDNLENSKGYNFYTDNGNWIGQSLLKHMVLQLILIPHRAEQARMLMTIIRKEV